MFNICSQFTLKSTSGNVYLPLKCSKGTFLSLNVTRNLFRTRKLGSTSIQMGIVLTPNMIFEFCSFVLGPAFIKVTFLYSYLYYSFNHWPTWGIQISKPWPYNALDLRSQSLCQLQGLQGLIICRPKGFFPNTIYTFLCMRNSVYCWGFFLFFVFCFLFGLLFGALRVLRDIVLCVLHGLLPGRALKCVYMDLNVTFLYLGIMYTTVHYLFLQYSNPPNFTLNIFIYGGKYKPRT